MAYCFGLIGLDLNWNSTEPCPLSYKNIITHRIYEHGHLDPEMFKRVPLTLVITVTPHERHGILNTDNSTAWTSKFHITGPLADGLPS